MPLGRGESATVCWPLDRVSVACRVTPARSGNTVTAVIFDSALMVSAPARPAETPHTLTATSTHPTRFIFFPPVRGPASCLLISHTEAEVEDVAVLDDVLLPLQQRLARTRHRLLTAQTDEVAILDELRADEPALDVGMDDAARRRRCRAPTHRPGPHLVRADREVGDESERLVDDAGDR